MGLDAWEGSGSVGGLVGERDKERAGERRVLIKSEELRCCKMVLGEYKNLFRCHIFSPSSTRLRTTFNSIYTRGRILTNTTLN